MKPKGMAAGALALVSCPCHLIITYPLLAIAAGAIGLSITFGSTFAVMGVVFVISAALFAMQVSKASMVVDHCAVESEG